MTGTDLVLPADRRSSPHCVRCDRPVDEWKVEWPSRVDRQPGGYDMCVSTGEVVFTVGGVSP